VRNKIKAAPFGGVVRGRRRQLELTQQELARRIGVSPAYVGHLEAGLRHPSDKVVIKLADTLGFERGELFRLANPQARALWSTPVQNNASTWERFRRGYRMWIRDITDAEMEFLRRVTLLGEVRDPRDFIFILRAVRHGLS
jgi:transcriptional regulator with XRE-family HTH domain